MSAGLDDRLLALADAVERADGRLEDGSVARAREVVARAGQRLGFGVETTVAALAGPTGAGKSSLFNALAGADLARVSRRRPTTGAAAAAVWGGNADALLEWLEIGRRHHVEDGRLDNLVLIDLPDFDSVERDHRREVDRVVGLADLLVWVVDPQKYADAAWHERYLGRLGEYGEAMAVALNQADLLPPADLDRCVADVRRLLQQEGLAGVPVLAVSATTGDGVGALRELLAERVAARTAAAARLAADVEVAAGALAAQCGRRGEAQIRREDRERLLAALAEAAGVPTVVRAVGAAHRRRGALATGWPYIRWLRRLRPDPLRRLRLPERPQEWVRTSLPGPTAVQRAQVDTAARALADRSSQHLPAPWPAVVRAAATAREDLLADRLDRAVAGANLHVRAPRWWRVAGFLQTLLAAAAALGALWLVALALLGYLRLDDVVPVPEVRDVPVPTALLVLGAAGGVLLALLARFPNALSARRRSRAAGRSLRKRVAEVGDELVVEPVQVEVTAHDELCAALAAARGQPGRGSRRTDERRGRALAAAGS